MRTFLFKYAVSYILTFCSDGGDSSSSEEGGGRDLYSSPPVVPPSSPVQLQPKIRYKKAFPLTKQSITTKSPTAPRKTLQVRTN